MQLKTLLFTRQHLSKRLLFIIGLVGLLPFIAIKGSFAQNAQPQTGIFLPLIVGEQTATEQTTNNADGHDHLHIGHIPEDGRFTTNNGQTMSWPPQVKYIEDTQWNTNTTQVIAGQITETDTVATIATSNPEIILLLGERFTFISAQPIQEKWQDGIDGHRITYFSYSNNITIETVVADEAVQEINTYAASEYQPPLRQNEVDEAIIIARQYWQEQGNSRVNELQGFTIQTFKTDDGGGYYDTRMSYVSFHLNETAAPELLTWVDLTTQTVIRAAIDQGGVQHVQ